MATFHQSIGSRSVAIVSSTNANPIVVTVASGHGFLAGERCYITGHLVNTNANSPAGPTGVDDWLIASVTATTITLTGVAGNGVGGATGTISRRHGTIQAWEAATDVVLTGIEQGEMYQDASSDFTLAAGVAAITLDGATTTSTKYRILTFGGSYRWNPRTLSGARIQKTQGNPLGNALKLDENYSRIVGIGVEILDGSVTSGTYIGVEVTGRFCVVDSVWCKYPVGSGTQAATCFLVRDPSGSGTSGTELRNCIAAGADDGVNGAYRGFRISDPGAYIFNCVAFGCSMDNGTNAAIGFDTAGNTTVDALKNCASAVCINGQTGSADFVFNASYPPDYCLSSDNTASDSPATNGIGGQTKEQTFFYAEADDFRLGPTSAATGNGVTLTTFTNDLAGATRTGAWEIGAYDSFVQSTLSAPTIVENTIGATGRDYATIALWEAATRLHCIALNTRYVGKLYDDADFALAGTPQVISGATTDTLRYRELVPADGQRFNALTGEGVKITATGAQALKITERNFRLSGVAVDNTSASSNRVGIQIEGKGCLVDACFVQVLASAGAGAAACIYGLSGASQSVRNCIVLGAGAATGANYGVRMTGAYARIDNCTAFEIDGFGAGTGYGFSVSKATSRVTNCIALDCVTDFDTSASALCDYNLSSDTTAPGPHSLISQTSALVLNGAGANDFRLLPGSPALNVGLSLSAIFSTDFDGETRKAPWELGCYDGFAASDLAAPAPIGTASHLCTLWDIERTDGVSFYFTDHSHPLDFAGVRYTPAGGLDQTNRRAASALRQNNVEFRGALTSDAITFEDLWAKRYDGAKVTERVIDWRFPFAGATTTNAYYIQAIEFTGEEWVAQIAGLTQRLTQEVGRVCARDCRAQLGDAECTVDVSGYSTYGQAVTSVPGLRSVFRASGVSGSFADEWFRFGRVVWLTGNNAGFESEVLAYVQSTREWEIQEPVPFDIQVGDTFDAIVGCDGRRATCRDKFANLVNQRAFPFMPGNDRMIRSPQR